MERIAGTGRVKPRGRPGHGYRKNWQILKQLELRWREHEKRLGHPCGCDIINMTGKDCLGEIGVSEKTQRYLFGGKAEIVSI